ncbi:MAG TPA: M48 family metalloprotease [Saprospiraceae bacterium]|nr:M48 family metalloprotease [Saprospiraceae bacterium]
MNKLNYLLIFALFATSCARNPVTGKRELTVISEAQEKQIGLESDPQIKAEYGVYEDAGLQSFITKKGNEMAAISHRPALGYEFKIVDSPVVNAFAVPGGYIYFTRGIMAHFNNEAEFAGVLGHEIGHITAKHANEMQRKQLFTQLLLIGGMIASEQFRQYADLASNAASVLLLKYSRDNESQSDKLGVEYSTEIGYNSHYMAGFFHTLQRLSGQSGAVPTFMSTHPDPGNRFVEVNKYTDVIQAAKNLDDATLMENRDTYLKMIDGIVFGEDPRQGFFENNVFYHPDLKFYFNVPNGWMTVNTPSKVQMAPEANYAILTMELEAGTDLNAAGKALVERNGLSVVESTNTTVNGLPALAILGDVIPQDQNGQQGEAIRAMVYLINYNGAIYNLSGLSYKKTFNNYYNTFQNSMKSFNVLKDQAKINKLPSRVKIVSAKRDYTLQEGLKDYGMPQARFNELSILNGMELTDKLKTGMLFKVIEERRNK